MALPAHTPHHHIKQYKIREPDCRAWNLEVLF